MLPQPPCFCVTSSDMQVACRTLMRHVYTWRQQINTTTGALGRTRDLPKLWLWSLSYPHLLPLLLQARCQVREVCCRCDCNSWVEPLCQLGVFL